MYYMIVSLALNGLRYYTVLTLRCCAARAHSRCVAKRNKDGGTKNSRKATKESNAHASRRTQPPGLAFSCFGAGGDAAGGATAGAEAAAAAAACFCM